MKKIKIFHDEVKRSGLPASESFQLLEKAQKYKENGCHHYCSGDYTLAIDAYEKALAIYLKMKSLYHHVAAIQSRLSECWVAVGNLDKGIECYSKVLKIFTEMPGLVGLELHMKCHEELGNLYQRIDNNDMALMHKQEVLRISQLLYGRKHQSTADSYRRLGLFFMNHTGDSCHPRMSVNHPDAVTHYNFDLAFAYIRLRLAAFYISEAIRITIALPHSRTLLQSTFNELEQIIAREALLAPMLKSQPDFKASEEQLATNENAVTAHSSARINTVSLGACSVFGSSRESSSSDCNLLSINERISRLSRDKPVVIWSGLRSMR